MTISVQYVSDIHMEFRTAEQIPKLLKNIGADVLVLAGDIACISPEEDFSKFIALLTYYCTKYKYILHVAGNHEFYTTKRAITKNECMASIHLKLKAVTKTFPNYLYLNCDTVTLLINKKPYMFIGATLWTKVEPKDWLTVQNRMNDYSNIYINHGDKISKFNVMEMQKLHAKHKLFIKKSIDRASTVKIPAILCVHHCPILKTGKYESIIDQAYEVDMTPIIKKPVVAVLWGHIHEHYYKVIDGIIYSSNPKGYNNQRNTGFKDDSVIKV